MENRYTVTYRCHRKLHNECRWAAASFAMPMLSHYRLHLFSQFESFKKALTNISFFSVIYSLSDAREERRNCWLPCGISLSPIVIFSELYLRLMTWKRA